MTPTPGLTAPTVPANLTLPAATLTHLRRSLRKAMGTLNATHALHEAGYSAGPDIFRGLLESLGAGELSEVPRDTFFEALTEHMEARGWGTLELDRVHPGLAVLASPDWAEADEAASEKQPGCAFTAGLLAWLFAEISPGQVAVLEVSCRSRGDDACRFLFGSEEAVHDVYGLLLDGVSLQEALERV